MAAKSLMSFGSTKFVAPEEPKLFGLQEDRLNTNESARVLPWFAGTRWLGITWIGDAFGVQTFPIVQKVGKKKTTTGYTYYSNFIALVCNGLVDQIKSIRFDDELVWTGPLSRGAAEFNNIAIPNRGIIRLYWGSETQGLDSLVTYYSLEHSAFRGRCYIVGEAILFGANRTNAPNIQLELVRYPKPTFLTTAQQFIASTDANPIGVLWDWWTDKRFGLGRAESLLDTSRLTTAAEQLRSEGIGVSPLLTDTLDFKAALVRLLEYVDGYPTTYDGKLGVELVREVAGSVPVLTETELREHPKILYQTWDDTYDEVKVKFTDVNLEGQNNLAKHHNTASFLVTSKHKAQSLERPWVSRHAVAAKMAAAQGRILGVPQARGMLKARESQVSAIDVGDVFKLRTKDGSELRLRCTERTEPAPGDRLVELDFESDRGWANTEYFTPTADEIAAENVFAPSQPYAIRFLDSPFAFNIQNNATLLYMVARGDTYTTEFDVWRSNSVGGTYTAASDHRNAQVFEHWGVRCKLTSAYTDATLPIDDITGIAFQTLSPDVDILDDGYSGVAAGLDHQLLAFVGSTATEIMALFDVVKVSDTNYTAKVVRGLYDTRRRSHALNTELWLQKRPRIVADAWPPFTQDTRYYKVQSIFGGYAIALADITAIAHAENGRTLRAIAPLNVRANGDITGAIWNTGSNVDITWDNTSRARTIFGQALNASTPTDLTEIKMEIRSYDGSTLHATISGISPTGETHTLTNAYLVSTANADFSVRVYGLVGGWQSLDYTEVQVRKV